MPLNNAELNYLFHLSVEQTQTQGDSSYLRSLTLATKGKQGGKTGFFEITDKEDLKIYLEDTEKGNFLTEANRVFENLSKIFLWVFPSEEETGTEPETMLATLQESLDENLALANSKTYTLIFSSAGFSIQDDLIPVNLVEYKGVIGASFNDYKDIPEEIIKWAKTENRLVFVDQQKDGWGLSLMGAFLAQSQWNNMQYYDKIQTQSVVPAPEGNWQNVFQAKLTHLLSSGSLGLFAVGGKAVADAYITEQTRFEIQQAWASYIKDFKPGYDDTARQKLEDAAYFVLRRFQDNGNIVSFTNPIIPEIAQQSPNDRDNFTLRGFRSDITMKSAVWKINGTIKGV